MDIKTGSYIIFKYTSKFLQNLFNCLKWKIFNNTLCLKSEYLDWMFKNNITDSKDYVEISDDNITLTSKDTKLITFYLPQYYENEVNNKYFGKGFMEWYNTTKSIPQYTGHNQPQLPIDVGFYNLSHPDTMYRQIELAKKYGIYGFCFYYYWFSGDRLLEKPLDMFLENKDLNMPFCLFWANETWSNIWGRKKDKEIIKKQELLDGDDERFVNDILKYFKDERYIKINNKPLLIIYRANLFEEEKFQKFLISIKLKVKENGFDGIYILTTDVQHRGVDIDNLDIDGVVEFSHQDMVTSEYSDLLNLKGRFVNPNFRGRVIDIKKLLGENRHLANKDYKLYKCPAAGWDNSARKAYTNATVFHMTPNDFKKWLSDDIKWTKEHNSEDEQIVFIDSWNEWAEGAHLEPDQKYGYAYLQAVKDALEENRE